jgi:hypothetical protein
LSPHTTELHGLSGRGLVEQSYVALAGVLDAVDDEASWTPTGCTGWAVRDLAHHWLSDGQRALVALHSPTDSRPDRDAVTYWTDWTPDPAAAAQGRRHTRVSASMFLVWAQLRELCTDTAAAVVHAGAAASASARVRTQGHVLTVDDLLRTLCVEATIHHLDLVAHLPGAAGPTRAGLGEVRRVLDALLGGAVQVGWSDERYALVATGRAAPTEAEARALGAVANRLPVLS